MMMSNETAARFVAVVVGIACAIVPAHAQWTVTNLNPAEALNSRGYGVSGGQQVGFAYVYPMGTQPVLWSGTAASWVDLHPSGGNALGVSDGQQVGFVGVSGGLHASLWSGTAASWVDLHPAGAIESRALGVNGGQQVGFARVNGIYRASLWTGTAASWVSLHPAGTTYSTSSGVSDGQQIGQVGVDGIFRASLWTGTAASWVDLNPAGATESEALAVSGGQQVGYARIEGGGDRASLWTGTAASWVDLTPAESDGTWGGGRAVGVYGAQQVGWVGVWVSPGSGEEHASLWSGTAASWVDLHTFLPPGYQRSRAYGIWSDANFTYVVGSRFNNLTQGDEAILWTSPRCPNPLILSQPSNRVVRVGQLLSLGVAVENSVPPSFQWRLDGVLLTDGPNADGSMIAGATTENLTITDVTSLSQGAYDCVLTNGCGTTNSAIAQVTVVCMADYDGNGTLAVPDIFAFLSVWFTGDVEAANYNSDCCVNVADIFAFLADWFTGC